jgi:hypothetical protein
MARSYNLLKNMVLGTALALTSLTCTVNSQDIFSSSERKSLEDETLLLHTLGTALESGMVPAKNHEDAAFLRSLGSTSKAIAEHSEYKLRNESIRYHNSNTYNNQRENHNHRQFSAPEQTNQVPTGTFICNYMKDFNEDGNFDYKEDFVGLGKINFKANESLTPFAKIGNYKGKLTLKVYNPKGDEIGSKSIEISPYNLGVFNISIENAIENFGEGTYTSAFYWNDRFWNKHSFDLSR